MPFNATEKAKVLHDKTELSDMISLYRLDFIAEIATPDGSKNILIELQKSWDELDIYRFRNYLAEEYARHFLAYKNYLDEISRIREKRKKAKLENKPLPKLPKQDIPRALPIVAIYIIDHKLFHDKMIIHADPIYKDPNNNNEIIKGKDDFIENLIHNAYFIQIPHIPDEPVTKLEKILSIFNQHFLMPNDNWKIDYQDTLKNIDNELLYDMLVKLNKLVLSPKIAKEVHEREEGKKYMEEIELKNYLKLAEIEDREEALKIKAEQEKERAEKAEKELEDKTKALEDNNKALENKDKALKEALAMIENLKKNN